MALPQPPICTPTTPGPGGRGLVTPGTPSHHRRILIVDDNEAIHEDFRKILAPDAPTPEFTALAASLFEQGPKAASAEPYVLVTARQGDEAVAHLVAAQQAQRPFSVAFVDVRMPPGCDGIETIVQLWKIDPDLQVVLCTAYSDYSWEQMISALGETDRFVILKKPFDAIEVQQLASALTSKWLLLQLTRARCETLEKVADTRAAELRQSEERFRVLAEHAHDVIGIMSPEGACIYTSPSYEHVLGHTRSSLTTAPACTLYHPDDQVPVLLALQSVAAGEETRPLEFRMQHRDGSWRRFEAEFTLVREGYGSGNVLIVARDVTDRRNAHEELRRVSRELAQACRLEPVWDLIPGLAQELSAPARTMGDNVEFVNEGFRELRKLFAAQQRLITALKTGGDTAALAQEVEAAAQDTDPQFLAQEIPRAIEATLQGVAHVSRIAGALQECARPEPDQRAEIDLHAALESTITLAAPEWRGVARIITEFDTSVPPVSCLPTDLKLAFLQIILHGSRAIAAHARASAATAEGTITLSTKHEGDAVEIRIRDTGASLSPEVQARLREPGQPAPASESAPGLSAAHATIVRLHAGSMRAEPSHGGGTLFVVRLPLGVHARNSVAA